MESSLMLLGLRTTKKMAMNLSTIGCLPATSDVSFSKSLSRDERQKLMHRLLTEQ